MLVLCLAWVDQDSHFLLLYRRTSITALFALVAALVPVSAVPVERDVLSPLLTTQAHPILSPYYVNFGNSKTARLVDAFENPGLKTATLGFATAIKGKVSSTSPSHQEILANLVLL
jgi:hypothetical protein